MLITSLNNSHIKDLIKLKDKKYRDKNKKFLIEGEHLVLEAYKKGLIEELILDEDALFPLDVKTIYVTKQIIRKISSLDTPCNILALVRQPNEEKMGDKILMVDGIQDPGNLGTIIRSATAFDIDTVILSSDCVDLYNPKTIRSTQGMLFHINILRRDLGSCILKLKEEGYKIVGTKVTHGIDVKDAKIFNHFALIVGSEGSGVKENLLDLCDENLYIKMNDACESLNVAVASSILMYELYHK